MNELVKPYMIYKKSDGSFLRGLKTYVVDIDNHVFEGEGFVECPLHGIFGGFYFNTETNQIAEQVDIPLTVVKETFVADGTDEGVVSNIPSGVSVQWPDGVIDEVLDGVVALSVDFPNTYTLTFTGIKYLRKEVTLEAVITG